MKKKNLIIILTVFFGFFGEVSLFAQRAPLTPSAVKGELEFRLRRDSSYATIWNTGYDLFRLYPANQDTAQAIHEGFMSVRGNNPDEQKAIRDAAIYWQKVHDYGISNVPVAVDNRLRDNVYWGDTKVQSTLRMRRPVGGPVPLRQGRAGLGQNKKAPIKGRRNNPYPGSYYPGVYPP